MNINPATRFLQLLLWLSILWFGYTGVGETIRIEGSADFSSATRRNATRRIHYRVLLDGCVWKIRTVTEGEEIDYVEAATDGTNVYSLVSFSSLIERGVRKGNVGNAHVIPGVVPRLHDGPLIPILWLTYASQCYLDKMTNGSIHSVEPALIYPYEFDRTRQAQIERNTRPPYSPVKVVYFHDGRVSKWPELDYSPWVSKPKIIPYQKPFDLGFTNSVLVVDKITNRGSYSLAEAFTYEIFTPRFGANTNTELLSAGIYRSAITNVLIENVAVELPAVLGHTLFVDYRFAKSPTMVTGRLDYASVKWLSDSEVRSLPSFPDQQARNAQVYKAVAEGQQQVTQTVSSRKRMLITLLILLAFLPVMFGAVRKKKQNKQLTKQA